MQLKYNVKFHSVTKTISITIQFHKTANAKCADSAMKMLDNNTIIMIAYIKYVTVLQGVTLTSARLTPTRTNRLRSYIERCMNVR